MATPNTESQERTVPAGEFKTNCLRLMDEVHETGAGIVVTKHRRPVVRVSPFREERLTLVGSCRGQLRILGEASEVEQRHGGAASDHVALGRADAA